MLNIYADKIFRDRIFHAFPKAFVNHNNELIIHPKRNSYFLLADVETEFDFSCKVLEWLSREASKSISRESQKYHLEGINTFLGKNFTQDEMIEIYTYLGNKCNHTKTILFIESGYDMSVLQEHESHG